jgi:hypothetical protein
MRQSAGTGACRSFGPPSRFQPKLPETDKGLLLAIPMSSHEYYSRGPLTPARAINPLLADAATIERFLAHCHRRRYPARTDVFRPGDPPAPCTT